MEVRHLRTYFIGTASGNIIYEKVKESIEKAQLPLKKLIMISSDGPNVNKTVWNLFNEDLIKLRKSGLVKVGFCNIHICHNAFLKGLEKFGLSTSEFIIEVYNYFDDYPSREEDFAYCQTKCEVPNHKFIKHVNSRWLTLESSGRRILEQWKALEYYFLNYVPNKKAEVMKKSKHYKSIAAALKQPGLQSEILFICCVATIFTKFTGLFQTEAPLIHVLYDELRALAKTLMLKVCKPETISNLGVTSETLGVNNRLKIDEINKMDTLIFDEITPGLKKVIC